MTHFLYYSNSCFYCHKVLDKLEQITIDVKLCNVNTQTHQKKLVNGGGSCQVPCLCIVENNQMRWMYESDDIINYLHKDIART